MTESGLSLTVNTTGDLMRILFIIAVIFPCFSFGKGDENLVRIMIESSSPTVVTGQEVEITWFLLKKYNVAEANFDNHSELSNATEVSHHNAGEFNFTIVEIDGQKFEKALIKSIRVKPNSEKPIKVSPMSAKVTLLVPNGKNLFGKKKVFKLKSNSLEIPVVKL